MAAQIFDGAAFAQNILAEVSKQIKQLDHTPLLAVMLVGNNEGSVSYIRQKQRAAETVGAQVVTFHFPETIAQETLLAAIVDIQADRVGPTSHKAPLGAGGPGPNEALSKVAWQDILINPIDIALQKPDGIIVQRPLPPDISYDSVLSVINPNLDIDGFHPNSPFTAPVAEAVLEVIMDILGVPIKEKLVGGLHDKKIVLIGHGETAGKPIEKALKQYTQSLPIINHKTANPQTVAKQADILISAVGQGSLVTKDWIKPGAIIIDVGISRKEIIDEATGETKVKLIGDCDVCVQEVALIVTPVPKGIGPINVACLMKNLVAAAK